MSFILDALRKSEHERQRQLGPSIAELPVARPAPRVPPWVWVALAALLTLNVALVAWFLGRETPAPQPVAIAPPATVPAAAPPPAATTAAAVPSPAAASPGTTPSLAEAPRAAASVPPVEAAPSPGPGAREVRSLAEEAATEPVFGAPTFAAPGAPDPALLPVAPPPAPRPAQAAAAGVPTIDQLPPQATAGLPPLSISLHIYANQPSQRAVFINGTRYREGDGLPGGAVVQEITPDGAVISYGGQRFLLPRQ
ncbi:MAG: general secretion pathway protein GspB [Steroidobacteraceae bacterium]|nr:general secretion pathway protein GspB [Steroidobacteraceae bacterium]